MPPDARKKGPKAAGGGAPGGVSSHSNPSLAHRAMQPSDPAESTWPKPDHPFYRELRLDCDYVWRRMMASVSPTKSQLSREVPYES